MLTKEQINILKGKCYNLDRYNDDSIKPKQPPKPKTNIGSNSPKSSISQSRSSSIVSSKPNPTLPSSKTGLTPEVHNKVYPPKRNDQGQRIFKLSPPKTQAGKDFEELTDSTLQSRASANHAISSGLPTPPDVFYDIEKRNQSNIKNFQKQNKGNPLREPRYQEVNFEPPKEIPNPGMTKDEREEWIYKKAISNPLYIKTKNALGKLRSEYDGTEEMKDKIDNLHKVLEELFDDSIKASARIFDREILTNSLEIKLKSPSESKGGSGSLPSVLTSSNIKHKLMDRNSKLGRILEKYNSKNLLDK